MTIDQNNPYNPPSAVLTTPVNKPGSPIKAVFIGLIVDIGGSMAASLIVGIIYGMTLAVSGASSGEIASAAATMPASSWFFIITTLIGCGCSALGGYLCARIAKRTEYKLGAIMATISTLIGLSLTMQQYALIMNVTLAVATFAAVMIGVQMGYSRNRRGMT